MHRPVPPLPPGSWLGLLGGGQLGRMFCMAAHALGYRVCVLDPAADSPAGSIAERHLQADYLDDAALDELARSCRAATTEFENVPARALERLARDLIVAPRAAAVAIAQDRIAEKAFVRRAGIEVAPHAVVGAEADLREVDPALFPGILKVARLGYDGKGQARVADASAALAAWRVFGGVPCVLEQLLPLEMEVSVVVARGFDGDARAWPVARNEHRDGILAVSTVPAGIDAGPQPRSDPAWGSVALHGILELLAGGEGRHPLGGDGDLLAGLGVEPLPCGAAAGFKRAKTQQRHLLLLHDGVDDGLDDRIDDAGDVGACQIGLGGNNLDEISFVHEIGWASE